MKTCPTYNQRSQRTSSTQFEIMVKFMEQHGDISVTKFNGRGRIRCHSRNKWRELTNLLNNVGELGCGDSKSTVKWKKVWSDWRNNTKKKLARLHWAANQTAGAGGAGGPVLLTGLTGLEQRILKITGVLVPAPTGLAVQEAGVLQSKEAESDPCQGTMSPPPQESDPCQETVSPPPQEPDLCQGTVSPPPEYVSADDDGDDSNSHRRKSSSSIESNNTSSRTNGKKPLNDKIKDVTDRYFEFEREREALAHEREMARIKQNEKLIDIFGRMVNVLETLTPSIEKFLNQNDNEDG